MGSISYQENATILKKSALRSIVLSIFALLLAFFMLSNFGKLGALGGALAGAALGGGGMGLFQGFKTLSRSNGTLQALITANNAGITLSTIPNQSRTVEWREIQSIQPVRKGIQKGVAIRIANPDAYFQTLSSKEKRLGKDYRRVFGSPFAVNVHGCDATNEEIARALNQARALHTQGTAN